MIAVWYPIICQLNNGGCAQQIEEIGGVAIEKALYCGVLTQRLNGFGDGWFSFRPFYSFFPQKLVSAVAVLLCVGEAESGRGGIGLASQSKTIIEGLEGDPWYPVSL